MGAEVWLGQGGGWLWGHGGQLCPLPTLPGLSRYRTCRTRGCSQLGRPAVPCPDLVGKMGPAWAGCLPGTSPLFLAPVGEQGSGVGTGGSG